MNDAENIGEILQKTGDLVMKNPTEYAYELRTTVEDIESLSKKSDNPQIKFASYFLTEYIDDIWCNLAVDSSYRDEVSDENIEEMLKYVGKKLKSLGINFKGEKFKACYDIYVDLVNHYMSLIKKIEDDVREKLREEA